MKIVRIDIKVEEVPGQLDPARLRRVMDGRMEEVRAIEGVIDCTVVVLDPRDEEVRP